MTCAPICRILRGREWIAMIPLVAMMLWLGVGSQTFLPRISTATAPILRKTTENVPFQVYFSGRRLERSSPVSASALPPSVDYLRFLPEIILSVSAPRW